MRKITFAVFICLSFSLSFVHAQQTEKFDPAKDKEEIRGYTIHLIPAPGSGFGFSIVKDKAMVWSQISNPFLPNVKSGFMQKSDAYKLAEWVVSEREKNSRSPIIFTPELARQLNISNPLSKQ